MDQNINFKNLYFIFTAKFKAFSPKLPVLDGIF